MVWRTTQIRLSSPKETVLRIALCPTCEAIQSFWAFVTGEASERCRREWRKTINGDDICHAMRSLGLDHYAGAMQRYLLRYHESEELVAALNNSGGSSDGKDRCEG